MATKANIGGRDHFRDFDIDSPEYNEHFDEVNNALLEQCPVARSEDGIGYYVVSRQEDVRRVAQDWQTFSSTDGMYPNRPEQMPPVLPEEIDPPYHTNWRAALNRYFTVKKVMEMQGLVREQVTALVDDFIEDGRCDLTKDYAALVPGRVFFAVLLGAPLEDLDRMVSVVDDAVMGSPEVRGPAWAELHVYIEGYLKQRQQEPPRDDFIDAILAGVEQENGEPCSWDDKVNVATLFLSGAVGTTASGIGSMARYLVLNPDVRQWLSENPDMHDKAIEEFLRVNPPVTILSRTATKDCEIAGQKFKTGDRVAVNYAAACRDPAVYERPMDFDPERDQTQSAVFGLGPHRCIGSHMARLEVKAALQEMLARMPDISLQPGVELTYSTSLLRILDSLPVEFTPGKKSEGAAA
jgi:cytochrome P450